MNLLTDGFVDALWLSLRTKRKERLGDDLCAVGEDAIWIASCRDMQQMRILIAEAENTGETAPWMPKGYQ